MINEKAVLLLEQIIKEKYNNVKIISKSDDIDFYNKFNYENSNYCTALMSDDKEEVRKFISNVKSSYLLINVIPTLQDEINITVDDVLCKKSTLIYEE